MNHYRTSEGERVSQSTIDSRTREAKAKVIQNQLDQYGYNFCSKCMRNDCKPIDCSHTISVADAKKMGKTELCWDERNINPVGRKCHAKYDKLDIQWSTPLH